MSTVEPGEWRCIGCGRAYTDRTAGDLCPHDDRVLVPAATAERFGGDALLGRRLADNYLIFDILGLGGFGAVYRAIDIAEDRRQVAIKTIRPGAERHNADARARFAQEARLLERLRDPHIVQVYHFGSADDALFMALELVPGRSLKRILRSRKRLSPRRAVHITVQILSALEHAHTLGLVHRDLKPANILVVEHRDDTVKVIDFGIAKVLELEEDEEGPKTGTGLVLGTVRYMAPEQLRQGGEIGSATDLYAVGIMFYEMVAGRAPFDGSQAEIAAAHLYQTAPTLDADLAPPTLRAWLDRVLLKDPGQRFVDATEMRRTLIEALPGAVEGDARGDSGLMDGIVDERPSGSMDGLSGPSAGAVRMLSESALRASAGGGSADTSSGSVQASSGSAQASSGSPRPADDPPPDEAPSPGSTLPDGALQAEPETVDAPPTGGEDSTVLEAPRPSDEDRTALEPPSGAGEDSTILDAPTVESALVGGASTGPMPEPATVEHAQAFDAELASLPTLAPDSHRSSGWGDIDAAPTALRETSGTIQAARGELGLVEQPPDERRRVWWFAGMALVAVAAVLLVLAPWSVDRSASDAGPVETIRLSVGSKPPIRAPVPDVAPPAPAVVPDATLDAGPPADAAVEKVRPRKRAMHWRQVERLEQPILDALSACRCSQARGLHGKLPRDFPRDRRRRLERRINRCKVPLVDQQCVDGEVR